MNNIVSISLESPEIAELERIKQLLSLADWNMRVNAICSALQSPIAHELESKDFPVPSTSLAGKLGHANIISFIESETDGLGIEWNDWRQEIRAKVLKDKFNIYADTPSEILGQFEDVRRMLNRDPIDAADFHRQIISSILAQKKQSEEQLTGQIDVINHELTLSKQALSDAKHELETAQQTLADQYIEHKNVLASTKANLLSEYKGELEKHKTEISQTHAIEMKAVTDRLEGEQDQQRQNHIAEIRAITDRHEGEQAQLKKNHSIEMKAVTERLEIKCTEITQKNKELESTLASLHSQFDKLRQERDRLETLSKNMVEQIAAGTPLDESNENEIKLLKSEIESINEELVHYKSLLEDSNHQDIEQLHNNIASLTRLNKNYAKRVKNLQIKVRKLNRKVKNSNRDFWQVFALAALSIGASAFYAIVL